ncbi:MAG: hypothetical protein SFW35_00400 [Chitinophagales bacterium]|nr:hypothetical protein [Chitinophagales bacterium]
MDDVAIEKRRLKAERKLILGKLHVDWYYAKEFMKPRNLLLLAMDKLTGGWSTRIRHLSEQYTAEGTWFHRIAHSPVMRYLPFSLIVGIKLYRMYRKGKNFIGIFRR